MFAESRATDPVALGEVRTVTLAERAGLDERAWEATNEAFPEYNLHGDTLNVFWSRLSEERPQFQFCLVDESDAILARGESLPVRWVEATMTCRQAWMARSSAVAMREELTPCARW